MHGSGALVVVYTGLGFSVVIGGTYLVVVVGGGGGIVGLVGGGGVRALQDLTFDGTAVRTFSLSENDIGLTWIL